MKIVTAQQMKTIEKKAMKAGISPDMLMEAAGLSIASKVSSHIQSSPTGQILSLIGPGNNGGDGLVASRILASWNIPVVIYLATSSTNCLEKYQECLELGIPIIKATEDPLQELLRESLKHSDLLLDALFGAGSSRRFNQNLTDILCMINRVKVTDLGSFRTIAVDIPSGIHPDKGSIPCSVLPADVTLALGAPKIGLFRLPGASHTGVLEVLDIGIPKDFFKPARITLLDPNIPEQNLNPRPRYSNKRLFGRVLIVAGSREYIGAARLAALAAYRSGSGLVTLATPDSVYKLLAPTLPEATYKPLPESPSGRIDPKSIALLQGIFPRYDAILIGCGLGCDEDTTRLIEGVICNTKQPMPPIVIDADGLNCLAAIPRWWDKVKTQVILTPHQGEMLRLISKKGRFDPIKATVKFSKIWRQTVVMKGPITIIAAPSGSCRINADPNPCLSTAGTGDILAGIIVALVGQKLEAYEAASSAVFVHSKVAQQISKSIGDGGMLASDMIMRIPKTIASLRGVILEDIV